MTEYRREIKFIPGKPYREGYGRIDARLMFILHGPRGIVEFSIHTGWYPETDQNNEWRSFQPQAKSLNWHWPVPLHGEMIGPDECPYLPGGCYWDGGVMIANKRLDLLMIDGEEALWRDLEDLHDSLVHREQHPEEES